MSETANGTTSAQARTAPVVAAIAGPLGVHEGYHRRWARGNGSGLKQRDPRFAHQRILRLVTAGGA